MVKIKVEYMKSDPFVVKSGLRHSDDLMSLILLNLVLEKVMRDMIIEQRASLG